MSIDRIVAVSPTEKMASRSKIMKRGADSKGKASRICCATQPAVGLVVTAQRTTSRRPWGMSIAAMPSRWFRRNVLQVALALGVRGRERRYLETLRSERSKPRHSNSPWMRGAPQGFSVAILRMSARTSRGRGGRPERSPRRDNQVQ